MTDPLSYLDAPAAARTVLEIVADACGLAIADITGPSRRRRFVVARHIAMNLARRHTSASLPEIGAIFERDHTTVLAAVRGIEERLERDRRLAGAFAELDAAVRAALGR